MTIPIWDFPLRLFHWLLVITILASYITSEMGGLLLDWHSHLGVLTLALIVFRIVWGFVGSAHARFSSFAPTPRQLRAFFTSSWSGIGHSPLGALSVFMLLFVFLLLACSGLFALDDDIEFHGPLYDLVSSAWNDRLTSWHSQLFDALVILIGLHLTAIAYYTWIKRKNLILPMITDKTRVQVEAFIQPVCGGGKVQVLFAVTIAGFVFWCIESDALLLWLSAD